MDFQASGSHIFPLDRQVLSEALAGILDASTVPEKLDEKNNTLNNTADLQRRLEEIKTEDWDLFLRILQDGSLVVRGVAVRYISCVAVAIDERKFSILTGGHPPYSSSSTCFIHRHLLPHHIVYQPN